MSRTRKAFLSLTFGYAQYGLALVSGLFVLPFILAHVDSRSYGLWLASLEVLAYVGYVDLGVISVLPWMVAACDGANDRQGIRSLLVNGLILALLGSVLYLLTALVLWHWLPALTGMPASDQQLLLGPLAIAITANVILFPARVLYGILAGLQDVAFIGWMTLVQSVINLAILLLMIWSSYGLYALTCAASVPTMVFCLGVGLRLRWLAPDLFVSWPRPTLARMIHLAGQGLTTWMAAIGWRMSAASNSLLIVATGGGPEAAVIYSCTAKLGEMLMPLAWQCSDSALVGLAQLHGEGHRERVREIILLMLRLLLLAVGGAAVALLAFNPTFVTLWVGSDKFGGRTLNALLVAAIVSLSLSHGVFAAAAVTGNRFRVGLLTLLQGGLYGVLALSLGWLSGAKGIATAASLSALLLAVPLGALALRNGTGVTPRDVAREVLGTWLPRAALPLAVAASLGLWIPPERLWISVAAAPALGLLYLLYMRPLYVDLPLPGGLDKWLLRLRLVPGHLGRRGMRGISSCR